MCKELSVGDCVPALVGCNGVVGVRNQGHLIRDYLQDKILETLDRVPLDVELGLDSGADCPDIRITDMPFVGSGVYCDSLGPEGLTIPRSFLDIRHVAATRVAYSGDFVYIDTQSCQTAKVVIYVQILSEMC